MAKQMCFSKGCGQWEKIRFVIILRTRSLNLLLCSDKSNMDFHKLSQNEIWQCCMAMCVIKVSIPPRTITWQLFQLPVRSSCWGIGQLKLFSNNILTSCKNIDSTKIRGSARLATADIRRTVNCHVYRVNVHGGRIQMYVWLQLVV